MDAIVSPVATPKTEGEVDEPMTLAVMKEHIEIFCETQASQIRYAIHTALVSGSGLAILAVLSKREFDMANNVFVPLAGAVGALFLMRISSSGLRTVCREEIRAFLSTASVKDRDAAENALLDAHMDPADYR